MPPYWWKSPLSCQADAPLSVGIAAVSGMHAVAEQLPRAVAHGSCPWQNGLSITPTKDKEFKYMYIHTFFPMKADRSPFSAQDVRSFVLRLFLLHIAARLLQCCPMSPTASCCLQHDEVFVKHLYCHGCAICLRELNSPAQHVASVSSSQSICSHDCATCHLGES